MINPKYVALVVFVVAFGFASLNAQAAPGDSITIPNATFVDKKSGDTHKFTIDAQEYPDEAGVGTVLFKLKGPRLSLTTVGKNLAR